MPCTAEVTFLACGQSQGAKWLQAKASCGAKTVAVLKVKCLKLCLTVFFMTAEGLALLCVIWSLPKLNSLQSISIVFETAV